MLSITDAQVALTKLGYYDGPPDGQYDGANFRDDLRRFQRAFPATGQADGWYGPRTDLVLSPLAAKLRQMPGVASMRRWNLTHYYVGQVRGWTGPLVPLYNGRDFGGELLAMVPAEAFVEASLNGSSILADGRLINVWGWRSAGADRTKYKPVLDIAKRNGWVPQKPGYAGIRLKDGQVDQVRVFAVRSPGPSGWPVEHGIECQPFRTVAADTGQVPRSDPRFADAGGVVPLGTRAYVLELDGVRLPDESIHDGWVTVNDTGGAIVGAHFDLFTGIKRLARQVTLRERAHVWFEGVERRLPFDYAYGL